MLRIKIKCVLKKIYFLVYKINILYKSKKYLNPIYIFGTPNHGNLGDQAILQSEIFLFKDLGRDEVIPVEMSFVNENILFLKKIIGNKSIYVNGGGNFGTIWPIGEEMIRKIIINFKQNSIIIFPNTFYFEESKKDELNLSKEIYNSHNDLTICCREKFSYEFMKKNFDNCNLLLIPDMVLYNKVFDLNIKRKKQILMCLRNDREKVENNYDKIIAYVNDNGFNIKYTDTVLKRKIFPFQRVAQLRKKLEEFSMSELIITDRLHGMVFAYLTKTPCIVFKNCNYKITGLYDWIKDCNYIRFFKDDITNEDIKTMILSDKKTCDLSQEYQQLIKIIQEKLK